MLTLTKQHELNECHTCNLEKYKDRLSTFIRTLKRKFMICKQYLYVYEPHQTNHQHIHLLLNSRWLRKSELVELHRIWGGDIKYEKLRKSHHYATKYLTKVIEDERNLVFLSAHNKRQYQTSMRLLRPLSEIKQEYFSEKGYMNRSILKFYSHRNPFANFTSLAFVSDQNFIHNDCVRRKYYHNNLIFIDEVVDDTSSIKILAGRYRKRGSLDDLLYPQQSYNLLFSSKHLKIVGV